MKKRGTIIASITAIALLLCFFYIKTTKSLADSSSNLVTLDKSSQLFWKVKLGHKVDAIGPFGITKATLTTSDTSSKENNENISVSGDPQDTTKKTNIYLMLLAGTKLREGQATDIKTDILAGFEFNNDYKKNVKECMEQVIPKNSNIVMAGHSLGGMVAQQLAADKNVKKDYNIMHILTYGSPIVSPIGREGSIQRQGDIRDVVPYISLSSTLLLPIQINTLNKEDGGYGKLDVVNAHRFSYGNDEVWGKYDVLGVKGGNATLTYDESQLKFYEDPIRD